MKRRDRVIGVVVGIVLGLGIVTAFVFLGSEQTIDAPGVSGEAPAKRAKPPARPARPEKPAGHKPAKPAQPPIATVRVVGGAPPPSGPADLDYRAGDRVRLKVVSDETVDIELVGLGITGTIDAGKPTLLTFKASKPGNYPLILTTSHIAIAQIRIGKPAAP